MAEAFEEEIRILLIGRTGHGKSTAGNMILDMECFKTSKSCYSCTETCDLNETVRHGVRLVVCDTPGLFDTQLTNKEIVQRLMKALLLTIPGFHVIAFVLKPDRFTKEMRKTKEAFFDFFGDDVGDYFCIICTHTEDDNELQEYIGNPHPDLANFLKECNGAIFPFEKKASPSVKDAQVQKFLKHARSIKGKNGEKYFTNPIYKFACETAEKKEKERQKKEREARDMAAKKEKERQEQERRECDLAVEKEKVRQQQKLLAIEDKHKRQLEMQEQESRFQIDEAYRRFREEMKNDDNVNWFIQFFRAAKETIKAMGRKILGLF